MEKEFLTIVHKHQKIIYKVCRLYRDNAEDREDLFQEIVYQLWKAFPDFRAEAKVSTWMYRIALNTAMSMYRKRKPDITPLDTFSEQMHPSDSEEEAIGEERLFWIFQQLTDAEKAIVSLYLEDFSYKEIADTIGISESNVGVKLTRIKTKLKSKLHSYGTE